MKVIIDSGIPFIKGVLEPFSKVEYIKGNEISKKDISDASALIIRTRTKCTAEFLKESPIRFIASATIGKDHVDEEYCINNGIKFTNAAGCNSMGVVQYVFTALFSLEDKIGYNPKGKTLGIIGAGNIGERLAQLAPAFGLKVLRCDPPLEAELKNNKKAFENDALRNNLKKEDYYSLPYVLENSDIITLHVPLNISTEKMASKSFFMKMKQGAVFINSSRGEVVDEEFLVRFENKFSAIIIDVWRGEPDINLSLLNNSTIVTPHIAGYSLEGKINASVMSVNSFGDFFNIDELKNFKIKYPPINKYHIEGSVGAQLRDFFPIFESDKLLRENPFNFEQIRTDYEYRREIPHSLIEHIRKLNSENDDNF